ncbi:MAG: DUF6326 family protein [bacterium]
MDIKTRLSLLWVVVMFNMAFADILSFMLEYSTGHTPEFQATEGFMLIAAILVEIPIVMIVLSRELQYEANRWANIIAGAITIMFVIGGGSPYIHYLFFATIEVTCMSLIVWYAWKWPKQQMEVAPAKK